MRGGGTEGFEFGARQPFSSAILSRAKPVVDLVPKAFTETLVEDKIKVRVDGGIDMRPKIKCKDQRSWETSKRREVKCIHKVIDVSWKPANSEKCYYGDKHSHHFAFLFFNVSLVFVDVFTRCSSIPHMQNDFRIK